jgi:hypothetical protein
MIAMALLLGSVACAHAKHPSMTYHDLQPNGYKRSFAQFSADVADCQRLTHSRTAAHTPATKRCLRARGYQWLSTEWVPDRAPEPPPSNKVDWTDFLNWQF